MNESSGALADLTRDVESLLKELSDRGFQVYPGKWSNSLAPLAVEVLGDTHVVSLLAHRPALSSPGAPVQRGARRSCNSGNGSGAGWQHDRNQLPIGGPWGRRPAAHAPVRIRPLAW